MAHTLPSALLTAVAPISPGYSGSGYLLDSAFSGGQPRLSSKIAHSHFPPGKARIFSKSRRGQLLEFVLGSLGNKPEVDASFDRSVVL